MTAFDNQTTDEVRPDKSGPAGYEDSHHEASGVKG